MNNFKCNNCKEEFFESSYSVSTKTGEVIFFKKGKLLRCPKCDSVNLEYINDSKEIGNFNHNRFNSLPLSERKRIMKERSKKHSIKNFDHDK